MAKTETYTTIERVIIDPTQYEGGLKQMAAAIRENNKIVRDAATVQAELNKVMGEGSVAHIDLSKTGGELFRTYKDISQGARDFLQIAGKINSWLSKSSPEWKALSDDMGRCVDEMGRAAAQSKLMQGVMGGIAGIVDLASVAIASFTGNLEKVPYQKLADFLVLIRSSLGLKMSDKDLTALLTPFVAKQQTESSLAWEREGIGIQETGFTKRYNRWGREITGKKRGGGGRLEWNPAVQAAGERQIAEEQRAYQTAQNVVAIDAEIRATNASVDAQRTQEEQMWRTIAAAQEMQRVQASIVAQREEMANAFMTVGQSAGDFAGGLWQAADAALSSGESFGIAVAKMVKAELLGVASRATVLALFYTAQGLAALAGFMPLPASQYFAAAGIMAGMGAVAGGAGLAISAATASGGGSSSRSRTSTAADHYRAPSSYGTSKRKEDLPPIVVEVYMGDKSNRSAAVLLERQLEARIRRAA